MIICLGTTPAVQRTMTFSKLQIDAVNRAASVRDYASGKSINVARVAHTLGEDVLALGFAGGDRGRFICDDLTRAGISHEFVPVTPPTRLCVTAVDESASTATELIEESQPLERSAYDILKSKLASRATSAKALVFSGTLPPGAEASFYADCVMLAGEVPSIVDAKGEPLSRAISQKPLLVKPNRAELAETLRRPIDSEAELFEAMREMIERGALWIVVTAGAGDTFVSDGASFWRLAPPKIKVVSAIGSGDAFAAGIATGIARGMEMIEACRLGSACAAANAITPFAGHLSIEDVERLLPQISHEKVK